MFISTVEFEVARVRQEELIRAARAENLRRSVQGRRRFGRQADRMGQAAGRRVRSMIARLVPAGGQGTRRFA